MSFFGFLSPLNEPYDQVLKEVKVSLPPVEDTSQFVVQPWERSASSITSYVGGFGALGAWLMGYSYTTTGGLIVLSLAAGSYGGDIKKRDLGKERVKLLTELHETVGKISTKEDVRNLFTRVQNLLKGQHFRTQAATIYGVDPQMNKVQFQLYLLNLCNETLDGPNRAQLAKELMDQYKIYQIHNSQESHALQNLREALGNKLGIRFFPLPTAAERELFTNPIKAYMSLSR